MKVQDSMCELNLWCLLCIYVLYYTHWGILQYIISTYVYCLTYAIQHYVTWMNIIICSRGLDTGWAVTVCMVTAHCPCNVCHWVCARARGLVCTLQLIRYTYGPPSCQLCTFLWIRALWPALYTLCTSTCVYIAIDWLIRYSYGPASCTLQLIRYSYGPPSCTLQLISYSYGPPSCQPCTFLWISACDQLYILLALTILWQKDSMCGV